jgi:hypothetical protein
MGSAKAELLATPIQEDRMVESTAETRVRPPGWHACPRCGSPVLRRIVALATGCSASCGRAEISLPDAGLPLAGLSAMKSPARGGAPRWRGALLVLGTSLLPVVVVSAVVY